MEQNEISFTELYQRYWADVYRFSYWLCGNEDDAKDITSETFVRIWTSETETKSKTIKAYLFTIARNLFLHQKRKMNRFSPITETIAETVSQPEHNADERSDLEQTMAAIQTLSEIERTILLLRAENELSYEEIATMTGLTVSLVKVKLFRARKKLFLLTSHSKGA